MAERIITLNPNEVLFKEGTIGRFAYVLKKGKIEISIKAGGEKLALDTLEPTVIFGEMAVLFEESKRTATATAVEYTELVQIEKQDLEEYLKKTPKIIVHILDALVERLRKTTEKVGKTPNVFLAVSEVLNLMAMHKKDELIYSRTVSAISNAIFSEPESIEATIDKLEKYGLISITINDVGGKTIHLLQTDTFLNSAKRIFQSKRGNV
jgi:CRP-like cAMP-binding protein